ncbi:unnamed protein product, partial [Aphanomyces euteiches]
IAASLAAAIQKNQTICELDLDRNIIAMDDLRLLIESVTHPSREVKGKPIKWKPHRNRYFTQADLNALKMLAIERGGRFMSDFPDLSRVTYPDPQL